MEIKYGASRTVILIHRWAIKFPAPWYGWRNFLHGLLANHQEVVFSRAGWPELCPVLWRLPGGFLNVMRRAASLSDEEYERFDHTGFINSPNTEDNYILPVEDKPDSFGWLEGRIVAVDYGN